MAPEQFTPASEDYFHDMDFNLVNGNPHRPFTTAEIQGRNMWLVWTGGDDRLWNTLAVASLGSFDLLKTISSRPYRPGSAEGDSYGRHNRWRYLGLVNEPCFTEATGPDANRYGLWLDVRDPSCPPDPFADAQKYPGVKIGARGTTVPVGSYYGEPTGIVGLRLFPNPDFDENAQKKWNSEPTSRYQKPTSPNSSGVSWASAIDSSRSWWEAVGTLSRSARSRRGCRSIYSSAWIWSGPT
jgi:hypothetical protein